MKQKIKLPCEDCGGKCCLYAPIAMKHWAKIKEKFPIGPDARITECFKGTPRHAVIVSKRDTQGECYFLRDGRCSIYTYRPDTCRKVGADGVCPQTDPVACLARYVDAKRKGHTFLVEKGLD